MSVALTRPDPEPRRSKRGNGEAKLPDRWEGILRPYSAKDVERLFPNWYYRTCREESTLLPTASAASLPSQRSMRT